MYISVKFFLRQINIEENITSNICFRIFRHFFLSVKESFYFFYEKSLVNVRDLSPMVFNNVTFLFLPSPFYNRGSKRVRYERDSRWFAIDFPPVSVTGHRQVKSLGRCVWEPA